MFLDLPSSAQVTARLAYPDTSCFGQPISARSPAHIKPDQTDPICWHHSWDPRAVCGALGRAWQQVSRRSKPCYPGRHDMDTQEREGVRRSAWSPPLSVPPRGTSACAASAFSASRMPGNASPRCHICRKHDGMRLFRTSAEPWSTSRRPSSGRARREKKIPHEISLRMDWYKVGSCTAVNKSLSLHDLNILCNLTFGKMCLRFVPPHFCSLLLLATQAPLMKRHVSPSTL